MASEIVFTRKARCRDCHRCVRACPVKAIRVHDGQAQVIAERCIGCGTCIRECPQHAKSYRNDITEAARLIAESGTVVASVAPSYAAVYEPWQQKRLASALRRLGFGYVAETAVAAESVALAGAAYLAENPGRSHIWSSCPAATEYIRRYRPAMASLLSPIASPMLAHARLLRNRLGDETRVIFIGPCVAKKAEAERPDCPDTVDLVLTFEELATWLDQESILLTACEESEFDEASTAARLYPLPDGGGLKTAGILTRGLSLGPRVFSASGFEEVDRALDFLSESTEPMILEPLFCAGGCVDGPATATERNLFSRRFALEESASNAAVAPVAHTALGPVPLPATDPCLLDPGIRTPAPALRNVRESSINEVLAATGKTAREDQLDCGACGYASCRDKAIAVVRGMAEPDMCIPYMRHLAETRTDLILQGSPNGILLLDAHFHIVSMNPAFRKHFRAGEATVGKHVSVLMDPEPFERLALTGDAHLEMTVRHERFGLLFHQILYRLSEAQQYVGIFVDMTTSRSDQQQLELMRTQTIAQAQELLDHQIAMAQQMAEFLGESTARGEVLVESLLTLAGEPRNPGDDPIKKWRWTTSTSK
ncbi:MAG TPA: [Fe-Fe] hydrogenase large subunit C-terminal domain-containing protein [Candidatus Limnocylindrales bacterium]